MAVIRKIDLFLIIVIEKMGCADFARREKLITAILNILFGGIIIWGVIWLILGYNHYEVLLLIGICGMLFTWIAVVCILCH